MPEATAAASCEPDSTTCSIRHLIDNATRRWPLLCLLPAVLSACARDGAETFPAMLREGLAIEVTGANYRWVVRYPGNDGRLGTGDDFLRPQPIVLPANIPARIVLRSEDYLYGFELPDFEINEIAVPDLTFNVTLPACPAGRFRLMGNQMCGYTHPNLLGEVRVLSRAAFARWWTEAQSM